MSAAMEERSPAPADPPGGEASAPDEVERCRARIEEIDRALVRMIAERVRVARQAGRAKREAGLPTLDVAREAAVVRRAGALAREEGIDDEEVRYLFWHLIGLARRAQLEES
jgi:chorismate mutase